MSEAREAIADGVGQGRVRLFPQLVWGIVPGKFFKFNEQMYVFLVHSSGWKGKIVSFSIISLGGITSHKIIEKHMPRAPAYDPYNAS